LAKENDSSLTRNLTVLFGFFFVMLSSIVTTSQAVPLDDTLGRCATYLLAIGAAIGGSLVGIDLIQRYIGEGISLIGKWGVAFLIVIIPAYFVVGIALLLRLDASQLVAGLGLFCFALFLPYLAEFYKTKAGPGTTASQKTG